MTSFYFEGEYEESKLIELGYSRDKREDKVQANLEVNVTAKENIPFSYKLLSGSTGDGATILENMEKLKKLRDSLSKEKEKLKHILSQLNKRKYKKRSYVEKTIEKALSGSRAKKYFEVSLTGKDGNLKLNWSLDGKAIEEDEKLDGKYILLSSYSFKSADDMLTSYKRRDKVEKRISRFKGL